MKKSSRIEWISIIYLVFFVLAVLSPSIHTRPFFGLTETQLEELTIFLFGIAGLLTFATYERLMERREQERAQTDADYGRVKRELIESYAYIGSMNRKIELLKKVANDTSLAGERGKQHKDLFHAVAQNACAAVGAEAVLIRFMNQEPLRTEAEYMHQAGGQSSIKVANKDLLTLKQQGTSHAFVRSEDGKEVLVVPSDHKESGRAFLLLTLDSEHIQELDVPLLKVFANQAEMLYRNFAVTG
ncbi:hypothetical protein M0Q28_00535 [Patescibacteria group bacterium]|jgi:hypothetical protein|nr:hypothetical protein [Patescibacteria group bacterium]